MTIRYSIVLMLILASFQSFGQAVSKVKTYYGPTTYRAPFGSDQKSPEGKSFDASSVFDLANTNGFLLYSKIESPALSIKEAKLSEEFGMTITADSSGEYQVFQQRLLLNVNQFNKDELSVSSNAIFRVSLGENVVLEKLQQPDSILESSKSLELLKGDHEIEIFILAEPGKSNDIHFKIQAGSDSTAANYSFRKGGLSKEIDLETITHLTSVSSVAISSDGKLAALTISRQMPPKGKTERWIEIRDVKSKNVIQSFRGLSKVSSVKWRPGKQALTYVTSSDKKKTLWLHGLNGLPVKLIEDLENMGSYEWSHQGDFLIYSVSKNPEKKDKKVNLLDGMASRLPGYERYSYLYKLDLKSGKVQQLTFGEESTSLSDISPDGKKIIFTTSEEDYSKLPYSYSTYWMMDLTSGKTDSLFSLYWGGGCEFLKDQNKLVISGGPSVFGNVGENVGEGQIANGYDGQAYIYDLENNSVEAITKDLDPSISSMVVSGDGKFIYFITTNKTYRNAFRYSIADKEFVPIKGRPEMMRAMSLSEDGRMAVATGNNTQSPSSAYTIDLKKLEINDLYDPSVDQLSSVKFGDVNIWNFRNDNGDLIDGRYYLPPNFDSTKSYPLIVYYYGGTTPVSRSFGGRYPYNWYAAQGYVVYIMQPRGCIGYGQMFSADHVNNWGKTTALDIIDGTKKFLEEHKFANPDGVGCIGASYGGFMTMYLLTQTDIFSAAVSHAGISSLSSYWGEGYWGYAYSAVATQGSFPWNRKDIYVDQSPLFQADKVNTPILLTHGTSDTNVPPGESYQFYTALKLLGKEAELLEVPGQDHWILDYEKYFQWKYSIIAWFDKHLKKEEKWWQSMYE